MASAKAVVSGKPSPVPRDGFTFAGAFGLLRHPDSIVDSGRLRHLIETNLPYARLEDAAIPVHITATSLEGMAVLLSKGPAIDAILASRRDRRSTQSSRAPR